MPPVTRASASRLRLKPGWRRLRFVLLMGVPGIIANALAVDLLGSVPFLLGNMAFVTVALRLDWRYGLLGALLVTAGFVDVRWTALALAEALLVALTRGGERPLLRAWARIWLPLLLPTLWLTWPASGDHREWALGAGVVLTNGLIALLGARLIAPLAVAPMWHRQQPFRDQLAARLTVATTLPVGLLLMAALQWRFSAANAEQAELLQPRALRMAHVIDNYLGEHHNALLLAAGTAARPQEVPLEQIMMAYPTFASLLVTDAAGRELGRFPGPVVGSAHDPHWFEAVRRSGVSHVSPVFAVSTHHTQHGAAAGEGLRISISVPMHDAANGFSGVIRGTVQMGPLHTRLSEARGPKTVSFAVLDATGRVVLTNLPHMITLQPPQPGSPLDPVLHAEQPAPPRDIRFQRARERTPVFDWDAVALRALAPARAEQTAISLLAAVFFLGLIVLLNRIGRGLAGQVARPLGELVDRLQTLDLRDPATLHPLDLTGQNRELQELIDGFDAMLARLAELHSELTQALDAQSQLNRELEMRVDQRTGELQAALARAERLAQAKSAFLANMSHELRTPLTAILGYTEHALRSGTPASVWLETLRTIERNGRHLLDIVNDVLDASKIEAGQVELEQAPLSPLVVAEQTLALMAPRAREKQLRLQREVHWPVPESVIGDRRRLQQVLLNLLGNAIKFTERGAVIVRVAADAGAQRWWFEVEDTGIGIDESHRARLFERFEQADASTTRRFGGTGLGLFISRELVRAMGGDITLDSQPGHGSRIRAWLPLPNDTRWQHAPLPTATRADAADHEDTTPQLSGRILVAEDVPDLRQLLVMMLRSTGVDVTEVDNGLDVVEHASSEPFDLLLLDMHMPVMDGREATRTLRSRGYPGPIIALTADVIATDVARYRDAGCDEVLAKPIDRHALFGVLSRYLRAAGQSARVTAAGTPVAHEGARATPAPLDPALAAALGAIGERFRAQLPDELAVLRADRSRNDATALAEHLHRLKGSAGSFGFAHLGALARAAETAQREGDEPALNAALDALLAAMERSARG